MIVLCDTDWFIDYLAERDQALHVLGPLIPTGVRISVITLGEVYEGIIYGPAPDAAEQRLSGTLRNISVISLDHPTLRIFGEIRGLLRRQGNIIGDNDLLIAATALRHGLTLVTRNRRHFDRIPDLRILAEAD